MSDVTVRIPTQLRSLTGGSSTVSAAGSTVGEVLKSLDSSYAGLGERIFDESGKLRRFVNVFVVEEDIRFTGGLDTAVSAGSTVSIVPAVAGG